MGLFSSRKREVEVGLADHYFKEFEINCLSFFNKLLLYYSMHLKQQTCVELQSHISIVQPVIFNVK